MKSNKGIARALGLVLLAVLAIRQAGKERATPSPNEETEPAQTVVTVKATDPPSSPTPREEEPSDPRIQRLPSGKILLEMSIARSRELHRDTEPARDLELIAEIFSDYVRVFREKPFGSENHEITAQLLGENTKQLVFLDPVSPALSTEGELLDRWGEPYRFHPLTSELMDVRSLGPDRVLWTDDDLHLDLSGAELPLQL